MTCQDHSYHGGLTHLAARAHKSYLRNDYLQEKRRKENITPSEMIRGTESILSAESIYIYLYQWLRGFHTEH